MTLIKSSLLLFAMLLFGIVGGLLGHLFFAGSSSAETGSGVIKAKGFILVDPSGTPCGGIIIDDKGIPSLLLKDRKGNRRVHIEAGLSRSYITLYNKQEKPGVFIGFNDDGKSYMRLGNNGYRQTIHLENNGEPSMSFSDKKGQNRLKFQLAGGHGRIDMTDEKGNPGFLLDLYKGKPRILMRDGDKWRPITARMLRPNKE